MRWRIRRIVNGCAAQQLVARRDVIAPEFISYGLSPNDFLNGIAVRGDWTTPAIFSASRVCGAIKNTYRRR